MYVPRLSGEDANLVPVSQTNRGPANRGRPRPANRGAVGGREADRIKSTRQGWAQPATAAKTVWRSGPLPVPVVGLAGGLWAALVGLVLTVVVTLLVWIFAAGESASDTAMRVGADIWLAAHGTPFQVGTGVWSLMPWAWIVFPAVTLWAAGRWVAHRAAIAFVKSAAVAAATLAAGYAMIALFAALFGTLSGAGAIPMRAVLHTFVIAFLVSGSAILWRSRLGAEVARNVWRLARPAVGALATLTVGAGIAFAAALIVGFSAIGAALTEIQPGIMGGIALLIGWLGYLPASLMWCLAYVTGAGLMVGGDAVSPLVPASEGIEMLGLNLVPTTAQPWWLVGLVIPLAAGVVLNRLAGNDEAPRAWLKARLVALAFVLIAVNLWWFISTGRLGEGRLELLGPSPLTVPLLMAAIVVGLAGDVLLTRAVRWWRARRAAPEERDTDAPVDEQVPESEDVAATS